MSERICCVVASPKTESRSAAAVAVIANTTMSWSVKSTVSIMDLHTLILSHEARANAIAVICHLGSKCVFDTSDNSGTGYVFLPTYAEAKKIRGRTGEPQTSHP